MYEVLLGNKTLYYPGSDDYEIYDTELNLEVGSAGEFQFKVPPSNPLYSSLAMGTLVTVLKNNKEYWRGEIRDIKIDFAKVADVYCLEDLAWLGEEYLPPSKVTNQTYLQRLTAAINTYNTNRSADRQFTVGYVYAGSGICNWKTEYEWSILDSIRNCICRDDYYVRVRRTTSGSTVTRYIDVVRLEDYGVAASQPIEYGYNLLDYVKDSDYGNLVNVLTPYGDTLEDAAGSPIYVYDDYYKRLEGTTISNSASITAFGRHAKAVVFDGVKNLTSLNNLASAYLSRYCQPQLTMEVSAVDLAEIEPVESINLGDSVLIIARPFAVNQRLYLTRMTIDLQSLDKNTITLSGHVARRTLTSQMQSVMDAVEEIPEESDLLKSAKANALTMLLDETQGGYVVFEYDTSNTRMEAINICNARTIDQSTKRWRWSQNGLGYLERANTSSAWPSSNIPIALTNDGSIVADRITTGAMSATRIRGGSLSLGGAGQGAYKSGSLYIYDVNSTGQAATDKLVGSWTSSGISVKAGTVTLGNKQNLTDANTGVYIGADGISAGANSVFKVTSSGVLNATSATISGAITATSGAIGTGTNIWTIDGAAIRHGAVGSTADTSIAISAVAFSRVINNASRSCMLAIGSKFGVGVDGSVYATGANIAGSITATSGAIGNINIDANGLNSIDNVNSAIRVDKAKGYLWQCRNGDSWGMFNTLPNNPPDAPWSGGKMTAYVHNGTFVVDNDGSLSEDGSTGSPNRMYITPFQVTKRYADGTTDVPVWVNYSDKRMKEDIEDITDEVVFEFFSKIHPKKYRFNEKSHNDTKPHHYGVIAQDIIEEFGEDVDFTGINESGYYHVNYREFHGIELAGIKSLLQTVERQQTEIDLLKAEINKLKEAVHGKH